MVYPALLPLMRTPRLPAVDWTDAPSPRFKWTRPFRRKTKIWFLRVCHHISNAVYFPHHPSASGAIDKRMSLRPANSSHRTSSERLDIDFHALTHLHGAFLQPTISFVYQNTESIPTCLTKPFWALLKLITQIPEPFMHTSRCFWAS